MLQNMPPHCLPLISGPFEVEVRPSDGFGVQVTAPDNWFEKISVKQAGDTLEVGLNMGWTFWNWWNKINPKVAIAMPQISVLDLSGACWGNAKGFRSNQDFKLVISGASSAGLDVQANFASVNVSGASRVRRTARCQGCRHQHFWSQYGSLEWHSR